MPINYPQAASNRHSTPNWPTHFERRQSSCIPSTLIDAVPRCANSCIDSFVANNYGSASCSDKQSINFLCTHNSGTGLTLGEGGLQCVLSDCTGTDAQDISVYGICAGIMDAIPETVGTITATLDPMESSSTLTLSSIVTSSISTQSSSTALPSSSVGSPTSTGSLSTIFTSTGTPSLPTPSSTRPVATSFTTLNTSVVVPTPVPTTASSTAVPGSQSTSTAVAEQTSGLTTGQVAGIAVAGFASIALVLAVLLFVFRLRKKRNRRRRSQRWSGMPIDRQSPSADIPAVSTVSAAHSPAAPSGFNSQQRYYASPPVQEKRRSFWRKSIRLEDIGVAMSPEIVQETSPTSVSSQRTTSRLLPAFPTTSVWPNPQKIEGQEGQETTQHPRTATIIEEELGQLPDSQRPARQAQTNFIGTVHSGRNRLAPQTANVGQVRGPPPNSFSGQDFSNDRKSSRIPLTPIYDNGNFGTGLQLANPSSYNPAIRAHVGNGTQVYHPWPQNTYGATPPPFDPMKKADLHKSIASDGTTFEEDSTPEHEIDGQLEVAPLFSGQDTHGLYNTLDERSPIKDLTYPRMPRPAAVSRQAEKIPRPRLADGMGPSGRSLPKSSRRDDFVNADQSFILTDSTSSQGRYPRFKATTSSHSGAYRDGGLEVSTENDTNRMPNMRFQASSQDDVFVDRNDLKAGYRPGQIHSPLTPVVPPPPLARLTPNRTRGGDLYLTVEN